MNSTLERGFKSWAERIAQSLRADLSVSSTDRLDPHELAAYLDVKLCTPEDIDGLSEASKRQLLDIDPSGWSAITIYCGKSTLIIYNPRHSVGRQASDIAHELAHVILGHHTASMIMSHDGQVVMRSYDQKQEDEANWLAWALLLPRDGILCCKRRRLSVEQIAERFGVSLQLVTYRLRITGVEAQMKATAGRIR